jgi:hypothetical protein
MRITCVDAHMEDGTIRHFTIGEFLLYLREEAVTYRRDAGGPESRVAPGLLAGEKRPAPPATP